MGLGIGLSFIATLSITTHHFRRRKALVTGIAMSGSSVGAVIFPISKLFIPLFCAVKSLLGALQ